MPHLWMGLDTEVSGDNHGTTTFTLNDSNENEGNREGGNASPPVCDQPFRRRRESRLPAKPVFKADTIQSASC